MSYMGFSKILARDFLSNFESPSVLEIGVDKGQTLLPLVHNLSVLCDKFHYVGIDVRFDTMLGEQIAQLSKVSFMNVGDYASNKNIQLLEMNSLEFLKNVNSINKDDPQQKLKFDLILIDGDHNYDTVFNELSMIQELCHNWTVIVCDDYNGRFAETDLFYVEKDEYKDNKNLYPAKRRSKKGVRPAVDDWINDVGSKAGYAHHIFGDLDPCFIFNENFISISSKNANEVSALRNQIVEFKFKGIKNEA